MTWKPKYTITNKMLSNIQQIGESMGLIKAQNLSKQNLIRLEHEARALSTYASVSIEGNPLPLTDVKSVLKNRPNNIRDTQREILNYNQALEEISQKVKTGDFQLTDDLIARIQGVVVNDLMEDEEDIGKYRKKPVIIRNPEKIDEIAFLPPDAKEIVSLMSSLVKFINSNIDLIDPIILAAIFHKQNVIIHPFMDGNGRTTRLLTTALLGINGIDLFEIFSFENYYNQNVTKYFNKVGVFGDYYEIKDDIDFTDWIEYFMEGILDELKRIQKTISLEKTPPLRLESHHTDILNYIDKEGSIGQKEYGEMSRRSLAARKLDFKKLIDLGLIKSINSGKATYYVKK